MNTRDTLKINEKGHLEIGGADCVDLAKEFGYKYDIADVYMDSPTKLHIELIDNHDVEVDIKMWDDIRAIPNFYDKLRPVEGSVELFKELSKGSCCRIP